MAIQMRAVMTRERMLDAAVACLVESGLAGATTIAVAQKAGMSQGALFKHFASKPAMLAAAVERILGGMVRAFRAAMKKTRGGDPVRIACSVLWTIFRKPEMRAVFEVYVAARTDADLATRLAPILTEHRKNILDTARELFPPFADHPEFDAAVDAVVYAMQGAALGLFAPEHEVDHLAFLERLARRELARLGGR